MQRALLIGAGTAAIFALFFVPTFILVVHGLTQDQGPIDESQRTVHRHTLIATTSAVATASAVNALATSTSLTVTMGGKTFTAEIAATSASRQTGLSGRSALASTSVLLFVFPAPSNWGFWMKDMKFPIDVFWLDAKGKVIYEVPNMLPSSYPEIYQPPTPQALYVIETNAGIAAAHNIRVGSIVALPAGLQAQ